MRAGLTFLSITKCKILQRKCSLTLEAKVLNEDLLLWCELRDISIGADVILDFVGASYWENHTQCVAVDGRIVLLGLVIMKAMFIGPMLYSSAAINSSAYLCLTVRRCCD